MKKPKIAHFIVGDDQKLTLFSGPCAIESLDHSLFCAERLKEMFERQGVNLVFKSSYDKANRSSLTSYRGPGIEEGLKILEKVKAELDLPLVTDVHSPEEAKEAGDVVDVVQIPAFLCRQTDLLTAAAETGKVVKVKKGQFMAPLDMRNVVEKLVSNGNDQIILTERGASFGYNNLVCDMRSIPLMQSLGYPVCFDGSHSVLLPGGNGTSSGGNREFIPTLTKAAIAAGADCLFIESHPEPCSALCDRDSVMDLNHLEELISQAKDIYTLVRTCSKELASTER